VGRLLEPPHAPGCGSGGLTQRGEDAVVLSHLRFVLTDLLTTTLDDLGPGWSERPREQGWSGLVDCGGRLESSS
jgi:hypothetical protein